MNSVCMRREPEYTTVWMLLDTPLKKLRVSFNSACLPPFQDYSSEVCHVTA